jgi:integrase/recombinase XerD
LSKIQRRYSITSFRKRTYQICKFLNYLKINWSNDINPPPEPFYIPKRIPLDVIEKTLSYFKDNKYFRQIKAIILLGVSSGARAEELYQLNIEDIDIDNRILHINHIPDNNQSTKTKMSRISFFNEEAKQALIDYLEFYKNSNLSCLFNQSHITRLFRNAPMKVKDLRKAFSQEWTRRQGDTGVKKILMGHSLRNDVDLCHYNAQSPDDLKKIYDAVMNEVIE